MSSQPPATTRWAGVSIAFFAGVVASVALLKASPATPDMRAALGLSLSGAAWVSSLFTLATVALGLAAGLVAQRIGLHRATVIGLLVMTLAGVLTLLADTPAALLVGRAIEGIGFVLVVVAAPGLMAALAAPGHTRLVLGIWATWLPAGGVLVLWLAAPLLAWDGWQGLWWFSAGAGVVALLLLLASPRPDTARPAGGASPAAVLRRPAPWLLGFAFAAFTVQLYAVLLFAPTFLVEVHGFTLARAAAVTSGVLFMAGPAGAIASVLLHRGVSPIRWMVAGFGLLALLLPACLLLSGSGWPGFLLLLLYGGIAGSVPPCIYAQAPAAARDPAAAGVVLGLIMSGNGLGILVGPPIVAAAVEQFSAWSAGIAVAIAACLLGIGITRLLRRALINHDANDR